MEIGRTSVTSMCSGRRKLRTSTCLTLKFAPGLSGGVMPFLFARRARMMGLYVSFIGNAARKTATEMKIMHHCVHRQFLYCAANPPTTGLCRRQFRSLSHQQVSTADKQTYPRLGPKNGATTKQLDTTALTLNTNRSATVPAPTASAGLPVIPAKKRHTMNGARLFEKPAPRVKSMKSGAETR